MQIPDENIIGLYGEENLGRQQRRYRDLLREYSGSFEKPQPLYFVSAPGRTELGGNHTDHNNGRVLCAAVRQDAVALAGLRRDNHIKLRSSAFAKAFDIDLSVLDPRDNEKWTTDALIRGVAAGFIKSGFDIGGFNAVVHSDVGIGSGLSSSASFEVLLGCILNALYNGNRMAPEIIARIGRYAENVYFDKPCGLMDQMASATGGVLAIDFEDSENPAVEPMHMDLDSTDYVLAVVDTGRGHDDLTEAYAAIPAEMKKAAALFGKRTLREVEEDAFRMDMGRVRNLIGDRAVLRALHFFAENRRVSEMVEALKSGGFDQYLRLVAASGASSASLLQNIIPPETEGKEQPAALALSVSDDFFSRSLPGGGVCRIHGGGFAGTIQAYVRKDCFPDYVRLMSSLFGTGCVQPLRIRKQGAIAFSPA
jgi:galactokinase